MIRRMPLFVLTIVACTLAACGGGGSDVSDTADPSPSGVVLLEIPYQFNGTGLRWADSDYEVEFQVQGSGSSIVIGTVGTDDDGTAIFADDLAADFASNVLLLTNGSSETIFCSSEIAGEGSVTVVTDTDTSLHQADWLTGPDLFGALITGVGFRVDSVDIVGTNSHSIAGALVVYGIPQ